MKISLVLFFSLLIANPLKAEPIRILTEHFPPYNFEVDNQAQGLATEVVQAVLQQLKLDVDIEFYPWARAYELAQTEKNILIYSIARIPERENLFQWVGTIASYKTSLYKLKANKEIKVNTLEQAKQYEIGLSLNDVIVTYLQRHQFPSLKTLSTGLLNIRMLANDRIDLIAYDEASFSYALQEEGVEDALFEKVYTLDELSDQLYMAFSPRSDKALVKAFADALQVIKANGSYEQIQKKYINIK
ncbi:transporter substrate-binding domain-containing protein [Gammaproteobacteria bacterium AS21]